MVKISERGLFFLDKRYRETSHYGGLRCQMTVYRSKSRTGYSISVLNRRQGRQNCTGHFFTHAGAPRSLDEKRCRVTFTDAGAEVKVRGIAGTFTLQKLPSLEAAVRARDGEA